MHDAYVTMIICTYNETQQSQYVFEVKLNDGSQIKYCVGVSMIICNTFYVVKAR
jgi:hypothetical protein